MYKAYRKVLLPPPTLHPRVHHLTLSHSSPCGGGKEAHNGTRAINMRYIVAPRALCLTISCNPRARSRAFNARANAAEIYIVGGGDARERDDKGA